MQERNRRREKSFYSLLIRDEIYKYKDYYDVLNDAADVVNKKLITVDYHPSDNQYHLLAKRDVLFGLMKIISDSDNYFVRILVEQHPFLQEAEQFSQKSPEEKEAMHVSVQDIAAEPPSFWRVNQKGS